MAINVKLAFFGCPLINQIKDHIIRFIQYKKQSHVLYMFSGSCKISKMCCNESDVSQSLVTDLVKNFHNFGMTKIHLGPKKIFGAQNFFGPKF